MPLSGRTIRARLMIKMSVAGRTPFALLPLRVCRGRTADYVP